jgi:hypothetical protein
MANPNKPKWIDRLARTFGKNSNETEDASTGRRLSRGRRTTGPIAAQSSDNEPPKQAPTVPSNSIYVPIRKSAGKRGILNLPDSAPVHSSQPVASPIPSRRVQSIATSANPLPSPKPPQLKTGTPPAVPSVLPKPNSLNISSAPISNPANRPGPPALSKQRKAAATPPKVKATLTSPTSNTQVVSPIRSWTSPAVPAIVHAKGTSSTPSSNAASATPVAPPQQQIPSAINDPAEIFHPIRVPSRITALPLLGHDNPSFRAQNKAVIKSLVQAKPGLVLRLITPASVQQRHETPLLYNDGKPVPLTTTLRQLKIGIAKQLNIQDIFLPPKATAADVQGVCNCAFARSITENGIWEMLRCRTHDSPYGDCDYPHVTTDKSQDCSVCYVELTEPCEDCRASDSACPLVSNAGCGHTFHYHCYRKHVGGGCPGGCSRSDYPRFSY